MARQPQKKLTKYHPGDRSRTGDGACPSGTFRRRLGSVTVCGGRCKLKGGATRWRVNLGGTNPVSKSFTSEGDATAFRDRAQYDPKTLTWVIEDRRPAGSLISSQATTFGDVFAQSIERRRKQGVSEDSLYGYQRNYERHLETLLGGRPIDQITGDELEGLYRALWKDPAAVAAGRPTGTLSRKTINDAIVRAIIAPTFNHARDVLGVITVLPHKGVPVPVEAGSELPEPVLQLEHAPGFLGAAYATTGGHAPNGGTSYDPVMCGDVCTLLYCTGARAGELSAVRVRSVEWDRRVILLEEKLKPGCSTAEGVERKLKSKAGFREVAFPWNDDDPFVQLLHRLDPHAEGPGKGARLRDPDEFLLVRADGAMVNYRNVNTYVSKAWARYVTLHPEVVPWYVRHYGEGYNFTPHALRRGYGSAMHARGIDEECALWKRLMGHARTKLGKTYTFTQLTDPDRRRVAVALAGRPPSAEYGRDAQEAPMAARARIMAAAA